MAEAALESGLPALYPTCSAIFYNIIFKGRIQRSMFAVWRPLKYHWLSARLRNRFCGFWCMCKTIASFWPLVQQTFHLQYFSVWLGEASACRERGEKTTPWLLTVERASVPRLGSGVTELLSTVSVVSDPSSVLSSTGPTRAFRT